MVRRRNLTMPATKILVSELKARGYRFVGLDAVPQVERAMRACRENVKTC